MSYDEDFHNLSSKTQARRVVDNRLVSASKVTKDDGPFYCDETNEELILRKCTEKIDHFAYKARRSPIAKKQSALHTECQNELLDLLQKRFPNGKWEAERQTFTEDSEKGYKKVIPDLSGKINNKGVIIEIQKSTLSVNDILHRTEQYSKRGGYILWIVPLTERLGSENFRPRLFERFLHTMYYGRVYYWCRGNGTILFPVHYGTATRWIEETTWFDAFGEEQRAGGYERNYRRVKKPEYGKAVDLTKGFKFENRPSFKLTNDKLSAPECKIFMDNTDSWWK